MVRPPAEEPGPEDERRVDPVHALLEIGVVLPVEPQDARRRHAVAVRQRVEVPDHRVGHVSGREEGCRAAIGRDRRARARQARREGLARGRTGADQRHRPFRAKPPALPNRISRHSLAPVLPRTDPARSPERRKGAPAPRWANIAEVAQWPGPPNPFG